MYTHLEDYVFDLYKSIGITSPTDLDMLLIANRLGAEIVYRRNAFSFDNEIVLVRGDERQEWMDFGHEICHYLRHSGSQLRMNPLFIELQEWQANNFAYHFCIPTFMLQEIEILRYKNEAIQSIVDTFSVDYDFAIRRLEMYQRKDVFKVKQAAPINT